MGGDAGRNIQSYLRDVTLAYVFAGSNPVPPLPLKTHKQRRDGLFSNFSVYTRSCTRMLILVAPKVALKKSAAFDSFRDISEPRSVHRSRFYNVDRMCYL